MLVTVRIDNYVYLYQLLCASNMSANHYQANTSIVKHIVERYDRRCSLVTTVACITCVHHSQPRQHHVHLLHIAAPPRAQTCLSLIRPYLCRKQLHWTDQ